MWCSNCQQEVPALGAASDDGPRCARCHELTNADSDPKRFRFDAALEADHDATWREVGKAVRTAKARVQAGKAARTLRYDLEQIGIGQTITGNHTPVRTTHSAPIQKKNIARGPSSVAQFGVWFFCTLGAVLLGLGIGLCSWSVAEGRFSLWTPGMMSLLAGQGLLIVGLLHLLANLWAAGRQAAVRLVQMHEEIRTLRRTSEEAAGRHAASAAQFYADLAREAGPEQMLGNLRGQIDALSARLRAE